MKAEIEQRDPSEFETLGLDVLDEKIIRCDNCKRDLVTITSVLPGPQSMTFQILCLKCGERTFKKTLKGQLITAAFEGVSLDNFDIDPVIGITTMEATFK